MKLETADMRAYLAKSPVVDFDDPEVSALAQSLGVLYTEPEAYAKVAYLFVRDKISHSADFPNRRHVTMKASEVLRYGEGLCYAKSHLLAALLRHKGIPCGFCYQILTQSAENPALSLHGLNAVYLNDRWSRLDARGNTKPGVNTQFDLEHEKLAYAVNPARGEKDHDVIFAEPAANVVAALTENKTFDMLWANLPDSI